MWLAAITFNLNVDVGLFVALIFGLGGMALAIFLGLRSFGNGVTSSLIRIEERVNPLSSIPTDVAAARQRLDDLWNILSNSLRLLQPGGTVEATLPNLGRTRVSATPGPDETQYRIETESPVLSATLIGKLSRETDLGGKATEMFKDDIHVTELGRTTLLLDIPSTDAALCAAYMKIFVQWLDTTYFEARGQTEEDFERGIFD